MTDLPVRLAKGDPAPEDCVAVPLHGPPEWTWRGLAEEMIDLGDWKGEAFFIQAIAAAAEAPLPLRKGDRVRIGSLTATINNVVDGHYYIDWDDDRFAHAYSLPFDAVTRLDDKPCPNCDGRKCMACVTREIHGKCVDDCPDCCGDDMKEHVTDMKEHVTDDKTTAGSGAKTSNTGNYAGENYDPGPTPNWAGKSGIIGGVAHEAGKYSPVVEAHYKAASEVVQALKRPEWTPSEGQLVEQISDGECFRLRHEPDDPYPWKFHDPLNALPLGGIRLCDLIRYYRPRCLRVGDVIDKIEWTDERVRDTYQGLNILSISPRWDGQQSANLSGGWVVISSRTVHIEGLGPVPWPPQTEEADR